jgi:hypothetical protein
LKPRILPFSFCYTQKVEERSWPALSEVLDEIFLPQPG